VNLWEVLKSIEGMAFRGIKVFPVGPWLVLEIGLLEKPGDPTQALSASCDHLLLQRLLYCHLS
jgi:hypothetical protein